jgi:thiol-disulfide isomerase/thioredoxin
MCGRTAGLAFTALACLRAQVAVVPEQPRWGERLTIMYNPSAPGAQLKSADPIWAGLTVYLEDHTASRNAGAMTRLANGRLQYESTIPNGACLIQIAIATAHDYDANATAEVPVLRPDGKPARGANDQLMWSHSANADRYFRREIELYPDNFAAYRHRWFLSGDDKAQEIALIRRDLETIGKGPSRSSAEWLYAMSYAYWRLGDQEHTRDTIRQMILRFPESALTDDALNYYIFRSSGDAKREARQWERDLVANHPASAHARSAISALVADPEFPFEAVQAVAHEQLRIEPANPSPHLAVANASLANRRNYEQALTGLQQALDLLLTGEYRIMFDPAGTLTQRRLADSYRLRAEIHLAQGAPADALADVCASEAFERANIATGHLLEARIWSSVSDWQRAETALLEAWRRDPAVSEPLLRDVFTRRRGSDQGFTAFLNRNRAISTTVAQPKRASPFVALSLDGRRWSLPELRGKTVVLNFWFIGCLPCRQEIPLLNPLVEQYPKFVFLAFALDGEEQLRDFIAKTPFRYEIVGNAQKIADAFEVNGYPTHIVINSNGEIVFETNDDLNGLRAALARQSTAAE